MLLCTFRIPSVSLSSFDFILSRHHVLWVHDRKQVGDAVHQSKAKRQDVFVTTKILFPPESQDPEETYQAVSDGVDAFGLGKLANSITTTFFWVSLCSHIISCTKNLEMSEGYVDLFLIHTPSSGPAGAFYQIILYAFTPTLDPRKN